MRTAILISTCLLVACGPSYTQTVKTPDEIIEEQEALAADQEKKSQEQASYAETSGADTTTESEKAAKFDSKYTDIEISRALRSALTCPGVSGQGPYGEAKVSLTFKTDGHVATDKTTINAPFADTPNGDCVLRAMNAIITKNFEGQPETKEVTVMLEEAPKAAPAEKTKAKK